MELPAPQIFATRPADRILSTPGKAPPAPPIKRAGRAQNYLHDRCTRWIDRRFECRHYLLTEYGSEHKLELHRCWIHRGPNAPGGGPFLSLTVDLSTANGWICHR
jgi:hypothetical protein